MQAQITAEREKRAVIATSEGKQQEQINLADRRPRRRDRAVGRRQAGRDQPGAGPRGGDSRHRRGQCQGHPPGRRGHQRAGRAQRRKPEGGGTLHRSLCQSREVGQHADRSDQSRGRRDAGHVDDDDVQGTGQIGEAAHDAGQGQHVHRHRRRVGIGRRDGAHGRRRRRQRGDRRSQGRRGPGACEGARIARRNSCAPMSPTRRAERPRSPPRSRASARCTVSSTARASSTARRSSARRALTRSPGSCGRSTSISSARST